MAPCYSLFTFIYLQFNSSMFFLIFLLFFPNYFPVNSLLCMTNEGGSIASLIECKFDLNIKDSIPDDKKLIAAPSKCALHNADTIALFGHSDGSCYAEVAINYYTKKMTVKLTHVSIAQSMLSPYDDMFGIGNGIRSVIQYKIDGNLEQQKLEMVTRIQCKTYDNCALDKLRKLLPNLSISETRLNIFKEVITLLNSPHASQGSALKCMINDDSDDTICSAGENRCKFSHSKDVTIGQACAAEDPTSPYDIQYRFNIIEDIASHGTDNSAESLKCSYLCKTDHCNSVDNFGHAVQLLTSLAVASSSSSPNTNSQIINVTNAKPLPQVRTTAKPLPQVQPKGSDGISFVVSIYYRSIIIVSLFIQKFIA